MIKHSQSFTLPLKLITPNKQLHWTKKYEHNNKIKLMTISAFRQLPTKPDLPTLITITRGAPRGYDYDNFVYSCKALRDTLSSLLIPGLAPGRADADERIRWEYLQVKTKTKNYFVEVRFDPL